MLRFLDCDVFKVCPGDCRPADMCFVLMTFFLFVPVTSFIGHSFNTKNSTLGLDLYFSMFPLVYCRNDPASHMVLKLSPRTS